MKITKTIQLKFILILFVITGYSCSFHYKDDQVPLQSISTYKLYQNQKGLEIAIDPFFEKERLMEYYFGADLLSFGILPVLVVIENKTNQHILVQKKNIFFVGDDLTISPMKSSYPLLPKFCEIVKKRKKVADIVLGVTSIAAALSGAIVIGQYQGTEIWDMAVEIDRKQLLEKALQPGGLHHGFIYFHFMDKNTIKSLKTLKVDVKTLMTQDVLSFVFDVNNIFDAEDISERIE